MSIHFSCGRCRHPLTVRRRQAGNPVLCPNCKGETLAPSASERARPAPVAVPAAVTPIPGPPRLGILVRPPQPVPPPQPTAASTSARPDKPSAPPPALPPTPPTRRLFSGRRLQAAGAAVVLLLLVGGSLAYWFRSPPAPAAESSEEIAQAADALLPADGEESEDLAALAPGEEEWLEDRPLPDAPEDPAQPPIGPAPGIDVPNVPAKADAVAPPLPAPGSRAKFKRRDRLSEEELRKQLAGAPEIGLERSSLASLVWEHKAQQEEGLTNFGTPNLAPTPLYSVYPGVKGLPMRRGREAQLDGRRAATLDALSRKLRVYVAQLAPADRGGKRPGAAQLRAVMYAEMRGRKPEWLRPEAIPVVMQMLTHEDGVLRRLLIEILSEIDHPAATAALAQRAVCDLDADLRAFAIESLKGRPRDDYREVLLRALRHPLPMMADHAAEALVALQMRDAVPALVVMLKEPDPAAPHPGRDGRLVVREVVRTNHLANCLLCHPPSVTYTDPVPGVVPNARWMYPVLTTSPVLVSRNVVVNSVVPVVGGRRVPQTVVTPVSPAQPVTPPPPASGGGGGPGKPGTAPGTAPGTPPTSAQAQQVIAFVNSRTSQTTSTGTTQQTGCHDYTAFAGLLNNVTVPATPPSPPGNSAPPKNSSTQTTNVSTKGGQPKQPTAIVSKGGTPTPTRTPTAGTRTTTRFTTVPTRGFAGRQTPLVQTAIVPRTDVTVVNLPLVVRGDVTYLRQDFSVAQEVPDPNNPKTILHMRFDYLVRTRRATTGEMAAAKDADPSCTYSQREAVLFALRELTGQDAGASTEAWLRTFPDASLGSQAERLAAELVRAEGSARQSILMRLRNGKGPLYTDALDAAVGRLSGKDREQARAVLVERLTRMTAATLRNKLEEDSAELRRAAVLACAQKDDPAHVPDLMQRLDDSDEGVVRAAGKALAALTGKDFATAEQWREWWQKQDAE